MDSTTTFNISESSNSNDGSNAGTSTRPASANGRKLRTRLKATLDSAQYQEDADGRRLRKPYGSGKLETMDERGRYRSTGLDVCDCLDNSCPGCHFPCLGCGSGKCEKTCRVNRKWVNHMLKFDGKGTEIFNPNLSKPVFENPKL